jgi:hypothetical protein
MTDKLDLRGVFGGDIILYNRILEDYYNEMLKTTFTSSIYCGVRINHTSMKESKFCDITITNKCFTNSTLALNTLLKVIIRNAVFFSKTIQDRLEKNLGIVLDPNIEQDNTGFMQRCNISASVTNTIEINQLEIENCQGTSSLPVKFSFYNTGDAKANCGIIELINAFGKKSDNESDEDLYVYYLNRVFGMNLSDVLTVICIMLVLTVFFISLNTIVKTQRMVRYKYRKRFF